MGAWGEDAYENDTAGDWFDYTFEKAKLSWHVQKALNSDYVEEQRAAAYLLEHLGKVYIYPTDELEKHLALAIIRLEDLLDDEEWIDSWRSKIRIKRAVQKQIKNLEDNYPAHPQIPLEKMKQTLKRKMKR